MPLEQSEAIVLRSFDIGEQDKIVIFFSRDKGIIRGIALEAAAKISRRFLALLRFPTPSESASRYSQLDLTSLHIVIYHP